MDLTFLPDWPPAVPAALAVAILALVAAAAGEGAARLKLPRLFGYVAAGALFGAGGYVLRLLRLEELPSPTLKFTLDFAAAVILFDLGQRVSFGWVRRNPALLGASVAESGLSFALVFLAMRYFDIDAWTSAVDCEHRDGDIARRRARNRPRDPRAGADHGADAAAHGTQFDLRGDAVELLLRSRPRAAGSACARERFCIPRT